MIHSMEGGFRLLLAGIVLVALTFSLMSVWPVLTETKPRQPNQQADSSALAFPTPTNIPAKPVSAVSRPQTAAQPAGRGQSGQPSPLKLVAKVQPSKLETSQIYAWVYTKKRVAFLKEPSGDQHRASSINHVGLEILAGTRLKSLRSEGGWILVQSPSRLYGWVRETDVSSRPPTTTDTHWALFPPR